MGTLSSCSFSLNPGNGFNLKGRYQNNRIECFLCGEFLSKRQRLIAKGNFGRLNYVIRSCYNSRNNGNDDDGGNGEKENKENSNLATMTSAEEKTDDSSENSPASTSSRVRLLVIFCLLLLRNSFL